MKVIQFIYEVVQFILYFILLPFRYFNSKLNKFLHLRSPILFIQNIEFAKLKYAQLNLNLSDNPIFWFHVSSAGEMEQAIPIARKLHEKMGAYFFVTYYSFSAEPFLKNFPATIGIVGLPIDIHFLYKKLISSLNIKKIFFVRYDIWPSLLITCKNSNVEMNLISATKLKTRRGFRAYLSRKWNFIFYPYFKNLFAVDKDDYNFFIENLPSVSVFLAGDGKWARALERSRSHEKMQNDANFLRFIQSITPLKELSTKKILVFGSPHADEYQIALELSSLKKFFLIIYVPHDVDEHGSRRLLHDFQQVNFKCQLYSSFLQNKQDDFEFMRNHDLIIIDKVGFLAEIYQIADGAIIGGGFDGQIHNVLEAAACGASVFFGPSYARAREASRLVESQAALTFESPKKMFHFLSSWVNFDRQGTNSFNPQERLSGLRANAMRLFENIPNTSEVVLNAFKKE